MRHNTYEGAVWGFWGTTFWGFVIIAAFVTVKYAVAYSSVDLPWSASPDEWATALEPVWGNGEYLSWAWPSSLVICTLLILGIIKLKPEASIGDYLALRLPGFMAATISIVLVVAVVFAADWLNNHFNRPMVLEHLKGSFSSAKNIWLYAFAIVVAAPIVEEIFVRGFLLSGFKSTFLGGTGAVVLTALIWAATHFQYDIYNLGLIFLLGLILGSVRLQTGSLYLVILLHMIVNGIAVVQTKLFLNV